MADMDARARLEARRKMKELTEKARSADARERIEARRELRAMDPSAAPLDEAGELRMEGVEPNVPKAVPPTDTGVDNYDVRSALSRGDTNEEKIANVESITGKGTVSIDEKTGRFVLSPEGRKAIGDESNEPVFIDASGIEKQDFLGDLRGSIAPIVGGVAGAVATKGTSLLPSAAASGAGSGFGKAIDELVELFGGEQKQSLGEVASDVGSEAAMGATGEVGARAVGWVGRKALGPNAEKLREGAPAILRDAEDIGITVRAPNLVNGMVNNIMRKLQGVTDSIFGDINAFKNSISINEEVGRLRASFNRQIDSAADISELARSDILEGRQALREKYNAKFGLVDKIIGDAAVVDTSAIRETAVRLFDNLPTKTVKKTMKDGTVMEETVPIIERPELVDALANLSELQTVGQLQNLRQILKEEIEYGKLNYTVNEREVGELLKSIDTAFDDTEKYLAERANGGGRGANIAAVYKQALEQFRDARKGYKEDIKIYDDALIKQIAKDPSTTITPYKLMNLLEQPGNEAAVEKVIKAVTPDTRERIATVAMNDVLDKVIRLTGDAITDKGGAGGVFDGTAILKELNRLGANKPGGGVITSLVGEQAVGELKRLGTSIQAATRQKGDKAGALVAAAIAVRPFDNLGKIAKLAVIGKLFRSPQGVRWLTEGYANPDSKAGQFALEALSTFVKYESQIAAREDRAEPKEGESTDGN